MKTGWGRLIQDKKQEILNKWLENVLAFYPKKMDFGTPIGEAFSVSLGALLDQIEE
ncbi:MAG: hypothetical protein HGB19_04915, partial [Chlorobiales bacterium]|nr:hypothetical protein [Chlorobiales bacterium]